MVNPSAGFIKMRAGADKAALIIYKIILFFIHFSFFEATANSARLQLRATSPLPSVVQAALEKVAAPTIFHLEAGQRPVDLIQSFCGGSFSLAYQRSFEEKNDLRGLSQVRLAAPRDLILPPCPRVRRLRNGRLVQEVVQAGDTLDSILLRALGITPNTQILVCDVLRPEDESACRKVPAHEQVAALNGGERANLNHLREGHLLTLPFVSQPTTVVLNDGWTEGSARAELEAAMRRTPVGQDLMRIESDPGLSLLGPLEPDDHRLNSAGCSEKTPPHSWPFPHNDVREAIKAILSHRAPKVPIDIRISDTGINERDILKEFPEYYLRINHREISGGWQDRDGNFINGDRYGVAPHAEGDLTPPPDLSDPWHGVEVAHLALGGREFRDGTDDLRRFLQINFARVFTNVNRKRPEIDAAALSTSLTAWHPPPRIVNLSIGGPRPIDGFKNALINARQNRQMLVMAAGNEEANLGDQRVFPPAYRADGDLSNSLMIIVGAHGPNNNITKFSNRGVPYVDLLAPGCRISRSSKNGEAPLAGTSFAAPLVSFTAGILLAALPSYEPARIIERIWATTRHVPELNPEYTRFGGILDIPAALRIFDDILRQSDGRLEIGRWKEPEFIRFCQEGERLNPRRVVRLRVVSTDSAGAQLSLLLRDINGVVSERHTCRADGEGLLFQKEGDPVAKLVRWHEFEAFIPAVDLSDRRAVGAPSPVETFSVTAKNIIELQRALATRGANVRIDGLLGPETERAIKDFQRIRSEAVTGRITEPQLRSLIRLW